MKGNLFRHFGYVLSWGRFLVCGKLRPLASDHVPSEDRPVILTRGRRHDLKMPQCNGSTLLSMSPPFKISWTFIPSAKFIYIHFLGNGKRRNDPTKRLFFHTRSVLFLLDFILSQYSRYLVQSFPCPRSRWYLETTFWKRVPELQYLWARAFP